MKNPGLITKALIEIPPKFAGKPPVNPEARKEKTLLEKEWRGAEGLAEDVRYYGKWMRDEAEKRIGHLYPKVKVTEEMAKDRPDLKQYVGQELTVIAWLWARTVASPNPALKGSHVPLVRSFWLSTKKSKEAYIMPVVDRESNTYRFEVYAGKPTIDFDPGKGTVGRKGGRCLLSGETIPFPHIRAEGQAGRMGVRLMAIVAEGSKGRVYISPIEEHVEISSSAKPEWRPEYNLPDNPRDFKTPNYGMRTFASLFTERQLVALTTFSDFVTKARDKVLEDVQAAGILPDDDRLLDAGGNGPNAYSDAVTTYLGLGVSRLSDICNSLCRWENTRTQVRNLFTRQAIPMLWDFAEPNIFGEAAGDYSVSLNNLLKSIDNSTTFSNGVVSQLDARSAVFASIGCGGRGSLDSFS